MKKFFSLVLALVMALSLTTVAWGAEYSVASGNITIAVDESGVQTVNGTEDAAPVITGTDAAKVITVTTAAGQTANFTIKDLTAKRIVITDSSAVITLEGANVIGGDSWKPAIHVTSGTLTIKGAGTLKAESNWAAAIGSSQGDEDAPEDMSGTINIEGGTITAKSGYGAAIGAGQYGEMTGAINITGGTVNATGSSGAAIGGSQYGDVTGTIDISAGTVTAKAVFGAAIGTGLSGDLTSAAEINISGGTVSATAEKGAGIGVGGGYVQASETGTVLAGEINISGGDVTATSTDGAGIGAGGGNVDKATTGSSISGAINITAGTVEASSTNGAGIGTGSGTITGGSVPAGTTVSSITGEINVSGGDVTASSTNSNAVGSGSYGEVDSSADVSLSTGDYSGGDVEDYVAPGSTVVSNGNTVVKNTDGSVAVNPVAQIGNTKYSTVADAVAAAGANDVIVLLDASATIPTGYSALLTTDGTLLVVPAVTSGDKFDLYQADVSMSTKLKLGAEDVAGLSFNEVAAKTNKDGSGRVAYIAANNGQFFVKTTNPTVADYAVTYAGKTDVLYYVYVGGTSAANFEYSEVVKAFDNWGKKCGQYDNTLFTKEQKADDYFMAANYKVYRAADAGTGTNYLLDGVVVSGVELGTTIDHAFVANNFKYDAATGTNVPTSAICTKCLMQSTAIYKIGKAPAGSTVKPLSVDGKVSTVWEVVPVATSVGGTVVTPSTDKVTSAETFDAGIAMYVGMSVLAATGSAVVLKKREG